MSMQKLGSIALVAALTPMFVAPGVVAAQGSEPLDDGDVRVIERGEQPWRLLRYDWALGATEMAHVEYRLDMSMVMDGIESTRVSMPMSMDFESTVTDLRPDGTARFETVYTGFDIDVAEMTIDGQPLESEMLEAMASMMGADARQIIGISGWEVYDARGVLLDGELDMPEAFPEDLRINFEQMAALPTVLPKVPVGVGATWEEAASFAEAGLELDVTDVIELLAIDGDTLDLETTLELAAAGDFPADELGMGIEGTVQEVRYHGGGPTRVELTRVYAETSQDIDMYIEMERPDGDGQTQALAMEVEMAYEVRPG